MGGTGPRGVADPLGESKGARRGRGGPVQLPCAERHHGTFRQRAHKEVCVGVSGAPFEGLDRGIQVARRCREVAPPGVDPAEPEFHRRQRVVGGDGGRCLQGGDRADVVALRRPDLAERQLESGHVRVPQGECGLEVRASFPVGVHRPRLNSGLAERLRGLVIPTGGALVRRDLDQPTRVVTAAALDTEKVCRAAMEEPSSGQARGLVGGIPELRVGEVEGGLR
ncbi:MAG: hypothetical protein HW391_1335 [Chloroflexi bacterium]|nr:hypothetical protein [Chloroflexota bacterium]